MAQLMPLQLTVSCFSKIQTGLHFWYRLTRVVLDKGPLNGCVCACVCVCVLCVTIVGSLSLPIAAHQNDCQPPPVSYKTQLNCSPEVTSSGTVSTCWVTCEAGAHFASDRSQYATRCGPSTNFSWIGGDDASRLLASCSGQLNLPHGTDN